MLAAFMLITPAANAYDVVNLPHSMTFADATGIFEYTDIASASICDIDKNIYKNLTSSQIREFYEAAKEMTVWRKVNPTPFRGECVNFTTKSGVKISYYYNAGLQIGKYGDNNYICYMPARTDAKKLTYLMSELYSTGVLGGSVWNVVTDKDFLKLPQQEWAKATVAEAAAKSLVPYEFTDKYEKAVTREEMAMLIANFIAVAGNYASIDAYMKATGTVYLAGSFADCQDRDEAIDCLYALGIISGVDGVNFNPDGTVTRQEAAAFMARAAELFMYVGTEYKAKTSDWSRVSPWATFYVRWCLDNGLLKLDDANAVYPADNMTVEQAVTVLSRLYDLATYWES